MKIDMVMDLGWGSSGKGGVAGYLACTGDYEAVVCQHGTQAGHTFKSRGGIDLLVQQLPTGIVSQTAHSVFLGPGCIIHAETLKSELERYADYLGNKRVYIHESAAVLTDDHSTREMERGQTKMGSTGKGVGQAVIDRILRDPGSPAIVRDAFKFDPVLEPLIASRGTYDYALAAVQGRVLVEGAQGFGLSLYHGDWPFCTSRDVTPAQIIADTALPRRWHDQIRVIGVTRTRPIRVNNRDGYSGPAYPFQKELTWDELGIEPERTTVTKLERRIFEFSAEQIAHAAHHCLKEGDMVALTFADYIDSDEEDAIIETAESVGSKVGIIVRGPMFEDVERYYV